MAKSAITTYGEALFQIASESSSVDMMFDEAIQLKDILASNGELEDLMANPRFSKEEHLDILSNVFRGKINEKLYLFLELLVNKGR